MGGWRGGDVDCEEGGGGSAAIGVEGGEGKAAGGAEGGTGESAGEVVGKEGLNLGGSAAGFSERHAYTKTESGRFGNHGIGLALTVHDTLFAPQMTGRTAPPARMMSRYPRPHPQISTFLDNC